MELPELGHAQQAEAVQSRRPAAPRAGPRKEEPVGARSVERAAVTASSSAKESEEGAEAAGSTNARSNRSTIRHKGRQGALALDGGDTKPVADLRQSRRRGKGNITPEDKARTKRDVSVAAAQQAAKAAALHAAALLLGNVEKDFDDDGLVMLSSDG